MAKSIKDFEISLGKRLFKREKFGMSLTREGMELYNDLRIFICRKRNHQKHISGTICNKVNIFYDWGKVNILRHCTGRHSKQVYKLIYFVSTMIVLMK